MRSGEHKVARALCFIAKSRSASAAKSRQKQTASQNTWSISCGPTAAQPLDVERLRRLVGEACSGLEAVTVESILDDTCRNLFDGVKERDVSQALVMSAHLIEKEPTSRTPRRALLMDMRREALGFLGMDTSIATQAKWANVTATISLNYIKRGADLELLDKRLTQYDLARPRRGTQTGARPAVHLPRPADVVRPLLHPSNGHPLRTPQAFSCALRWGWRSTRSIVRGVQSEFYDLLSSFEFMKLDPDVVQFRHAASAAVQLLPHHGAGRPRRHLQLDQGQRAAVQVRRRPGQRLDRVRGMGAISKAPTASRRAWSPFLKVANDTAVAVNQGGKRKGCRVPISRPGTSISRSSRPAQEHR